MVERFIDSADTVKEMIDAEESKEAKSCFNALIKLPGDDRSDFAALEALVCSFEPIRAMKNAMEASSYPTLPLLLPMFTQTKDFLGRLSAGAGQKGEYIRKFADLTLQHLEKIEIHPLWVAAAILQPRLRQLGFIRNSTSRQLLKAKGCTLLRQLLDKNESDEVVEVEPVADEQRATKRIKELFEIGLYSTFNLEAALDIPTCHPEDKQDELKRYLGYWFSEEVSKGVMLDKMSIVRFWASKKYRAIFPRVSTVSLPIMATPASFASSERNFSFNNRLITSQRIRLSERLVEDLVLARSTFTAARP